MLRGNIFVFIFCCLCFLAFMMFFFNGPSEEAPSVTARSNEPPSPGSQQDDEPLSFINSRFTEARPLGETSITPKPKPVTPVLNEAPKIILETRKPVRDVTPEEIVQAPKIDTTVLERLPAVKPPKPLAKSKTKPRRWTRPAVVETGILKSRDSILKLTGIKPVELDRVCKLKNGKKWHCGKMARTRFRRFIRSRPVICDPVESPTQNIRTHCRVGKKDISAWLVRHGWAEPNGGHYKTELDQAKKEKRGIWRTSRP